MISDPLKLVERWSANAKRSQVANYNAAKHFSSLNRHLGIPAIIASAVVGATVFISVVAEVPVWLQISIGLASLTAAVLSSLQTFLIAEEKAASHRAVGAEYGAVKREAHEILSLASSSAEVDPSRLQRIRKRLDELSKEAPVIPDKIWAKAIREFPLATSNNDDRNLQ